MARTGFEKLRVYQLAEELSDFVWEVTQKWDRLSQDSFGKEMIHAADAIGAHIAEGAGRGNHTENRKFARMARGALFALKHWIRRAEKRDLLSEEEKEMFNKLVDELSPRLSAYINAIGKRAKPAENPLYTTH